MTGRGLADRIAFGDLTDRIAAVLLRAGCSTEVARILAGNCAACERDGTLSHGVFRIPGYLASLNAGWVDGTAEPGLESAGPSFLRIDARNGFAQPAMAAASAIVSNMLAETGVALVALRDSHHFSALWPDVEPWAERGFVALTAVTGGPAVMPFGARERLFGTNPIAFAAPVAGRAPLVFDFATARMSQGDVRLALRAGRRVPPDTGLDADGAPTDDPARVLDGGGILPFGGHKGAALSLMVEILASAFTGGPFGHEVDWSTHPGAETPRTGQFFLIADPERGQGRRFSARIAGLLDVMKRAGATRLPGEHRHSQRAAAESAGIPVSDEMRRVLA